MVVNGYDGNQTALSAGSVYKTQTSPDDCDLLNILPCPANIDAAEKRTQFAKAWKEDHAVTANWSRENPHLLVIGDIAIGGGRCSYLGANVLRTPACGLNQHPVKAILA